MEEFSIENMINNLGIYEESQNKKQKNVVCFKSLKNQNCNMNKKL